MSNSLDHTPHEPSLEEEVQRVLRAGELAKEASVGATATERERIDDWSDESGGTTRAAVDEVKDKIQHVTDNAATGELSATANVSSAQRRQAVYNSIGTSANSSKATNAAPSNAGEVADTVKQQASVIGGQIADRADVALNTTGERIGDVADTVRAYAPSGKAGEVVGKAADALDQSGEYLEHASASTLISDLTDLVRRRPIPSLLVALGLGYLFVRATRSNDNDRYYPTA